MIKIDKGEFTVKGDIDIILTEISLLVFCLLENDVEYYLIQMAVEKGFEHYLKEGK